MLFAYHAIKEMEMAIAILCGVALCFLGWIFVLKAELQDMKEENRKLRAMLKLGVRTKTKDVEVEKGKRSWGKKPRWMR